MARSCFMGEIKTKLTMLLLAGLLLPSTSIAESGLTEEIDYDCKQSSSADVSCDYRLLSPQPVTAISARINEQSLPVKKKSYPSAGDKTAVLFLIDTSDPRRSKAIARNIEHVSTLLGKLESHHIAGLATFDSNLDIRLMPGATAQSIKDVLNNKVEAIGKTTELYRNTLQAVKLLADTRANRKLIVLLSDGLAEDQAYHHQDVISAAHKANVVINTIGYAQSVSQSVSLQTLRRLSEESGGQFIAAGLPNYTLPESYLKQPFAIIDNGGSFSVDLGKAIDGGLYDNQILQIQVKAGAQTIKFDSTVKLPEAPAPIVEAVPSLEVDPIELMGKIPVQDLQAPATPAPVVITTPAPASNTTNPWLWYGLPLSFLIAVIVALLYYGKIFRRKEEQSSAAAAEVKATAAFAYLVRTDGSDERFSIDMNPWRIGRSKNNEMALHDESISRQHAEIHRDAEGRVVLTDLDSLNGVYVNDKKVKSSVLLEGDMVDLGDVSFKYSLHDEDYEEQMPTVIIKTSMPPKTQTGSA